MGGETVQMASSCSSNWTGRHYKIPSRAITSTSAVTRRERGDLFSGQALTWQPESRDHPIWFRYL